MTDKLLIYMLQKQEENKKKAASELPKAQKGKQVLRKPGETVIVDGKKMNTFSDV